VVDGKINEFINFKKAIDNINREDPVRHDLLKKLVPIEHKQDIQHYIDIKKPKEYKFIALKRYVKQLNDVEIQNINHQWLEMFVKSRFSNRYAESTINKITAVISILLLFIIFN
jgi:transcriptional regulatory protein LevR